MACRGPHRFPSDIQPLLERLAGGFLILIKGVGINVQRRGGLGMTEEASHRRHVSAVGNQQTGVAVTEAVDVQLFGKAILLEYQLEAPSECLCVVKKQGYVKDTQPRYSKPLRHISAGQKGHEYEN